MFGLSDEYYGELRLHTYHLDGDGYQKYFFKEQELLMKREWFAHIKDVPKEYILSAPQCLGESGYDFNGYIVSNAVLRFQRTINTLLREGIIRRLKEKSSRVYIMEIGGGYGALAYQLSKRLENTTYVIVDLPETLLFSAVYLSICLPEKSIYIYDKDYYVKLNSNFSGYDFVLIPNTVVSSLKGMQFDTVLNTASFQEMRPTQLNIYLDLISEVLIGELYSWNEDVQLQNTERVNVSVQLRKRFNVKRINHGVSSLRYRSGFSYLLLDMSLRKILNRFFIKPSVPSIEYICTKK